MTAIDDSGRQAGTLTPTDNRTQTQSNMINGNVRQYINHTTTGTNPSSAGTGSWTFKWTAPAQSVGRVTFYAAGNAANNDSQTDGDSIYTTSANIQPAAVITPLASVSAASFAPSGPLSSEAITAAFGTGLSQNVVTAGGVPLPVQLDGTEVIVKDQAGTDRPAGLFFVSPQQINYLIPAGTGNGTATVTVRRNSVDSAQGTVVIESVAPGAFSANRSGKDVAAAVILRRRDNIDTFESVAQLNPTTSMFEPLPIDLGPETDIVVLLLYGTAFRNRSSLTNVTCNIGGTPVQVLFAGASPDFVGLDQSNLLLPRSLIGRGVVNIEFVVDGKTANIVTLNIK